jgi:hypothetical protein
VWPITSELLCSAPVINRTLIGSRAFRSGLVHSIVTRALRSRLSISQYPSWRCGKRVACKQMARKHRTLDIRPP